MRNKLGLVQIKVRAKDSSTLDFDALQFSDLEITGNLEDAKGGKLIALDIYIEDANGESIFYYGITLLHEEKIIVVGVISTIPQAIQITLERDAIDITGLE